MPNATMNRWIQGILLFDFKLIHVPAEKHQGPDALSRRPRADGEEIEEDNDEDLDAMYLLTYAGPFSKASLATARHEYPPDRIPSAYNAAVPHPQDIGLQDIFKFLKSGTPPEELSLKQRRRFIKKALQYFIKDGRMWKRAGLETPLRVILEPTRRVAILLRAHEEAGHHGTLSTFNLIRKRFYWPYLHQDVEYHTQSCHECQLRSTKHIQLPLQVSIPATLFTKVYIDVMVMPERSSGFKYIVAARDDLSRAPEGRALRKANSHSLAKFFWEEIYCRYGAIAQVTTDNGPEVKGAFEQLLDRYGLPQVKISPYNSKANGVVERGHFDIREAIIKACNGKPNKWSEHVPFAFFADKITTNRSTGSTPFYLLYGVEPVLPFDLFEATFLTQGYFNGMTHAELIKERLIQLQKRPEELAAASAALYASRFRSKELFEEKYQHRMRHRGRDLSAQPLQPGEWCIVANSAVAKSLNRKDKYRFLGPYKIYRINRAGNYILQEPDGAVNMQAIAKDRLLPYFGRDEDTLRAKGRAAPALKQAHIRVEEDTGHRRRERKDSDDENTSDDTDSNESDTEAEGAPRRSGRLRA